MTTHTETLTSLLKLPSEVLRLRLAGANLAMNGSKRDQARRLWDHIRQNPPTDQRRSRRQTRERGHGTTTTTSQPSQQHTQANIAEEESNSSGDDSNVRFSMFNVRFLTRVYVLAQGARRKSADFFPKSALRIW